MKRNRFWVLTILTMLLLALLFTGCTVPDETTSEEGTTEENTTEEGTTEEPVLLPEPSDVIEEGIYWPDDQMLPWFAQPASAVDAVFREQFDSEEMLTVTALQGIVNKTKPRLLVLSSNEEEGTLTWPNTIGSRIRQISDAKALDTLAGYASECSGVVLYSLTRSEHYRNLALTAASTMNAIPMTFDVYLKWQKAGIELPILADLSNLTYTSEVDIYNYMYDNYWKDCNHRLLISLSPSNTYNLHDMASALGSATVYLDCMNTAQEEVLAKFLDDMTPGQGLVMGWFTSERSGITTVAEHGLTTVPADYFNNGTVYSGVSHTIKTDGIPTMPELDNKVYVMVIVSDGDNIQYNQHAMRVKWGTGRGTVPINWTISPALVDIAPNILNYYYASATDNDCLVCGPSGYGYALIVNSLAEAGAPIGNYMSDLNDFKAYVSVTDRYLMRSGLRVVTVWDYATAQQLNAYTGMTDYLWGLTVQDWSGKAGNLTQVMNGTLVQELSHHYATSMDEAFTALELSVIRASKTKPTFLAIQLSVWGDFKASDVATLEKRLQAINPNVEFVRADHYYALYNQANGLPFDLCLLPDFSVTASGAKTSVKKLTDAVTTNFWKASEVGEESILFTLGSAYDLTELRVYHAEAAGLSPSLNTVSYAVEVSNDGENFTRVYTVENNTEKYNQLDIAAEDVVAIRLVILDGGADGYARLADVEIYGKVSG